MFFRNGIILFINMCSMLLSSALFAADIKPPKLIEFDFEPKVVDVFERSQQVIVTLRISDNDSGAEAPHISFGSSTTAQSSGFANVTLVSGDTNDGVWQAVVTIPKDSAPGIWNANLFPLSDIAGNSNSTFGPGAGFPNELTVVSSDSDVEAPRLVAFDFEPKKINVYERSQQVIVTLGITDNDSGTEAPNISFGSSTTTQSSGFANITLVSGDTNDGVWQAVVTLPKDSAPGIWNANLFPLSDIAGNSNSMFGPGAGFSNELTVVSSNSDVQAPRLIAFDFEPKKVNVYGHSQQVIVTLRITDNDSGAKAPHISFGSSTTTQSSGFANVTLVSGDANDGVWQAVVTIPKDSAPGIWNANLFPLSDIAGNSNSMFGPGAGFSDQLTVVNPSDTDGDGLTDAWEVANGLNPNDPRDVNQDKDGDGVSNLVEYQESTDPSDASDYPIWFHGPSRSGWRVILQ